MKENILVMRRPDDFHLHLRDDNMLGWVLPETANVFGRALVMPNTTPPVLMASDVQDYRREIIDTLGVVSVSVPFTPLMTMQITYQTTPDMVLAAKAAGAIAGKIYPKNMTTNSANGIMVYNSKGLCDVYAVMQETGMVLCLHGESPRPEIYCLDREQEFLPTVKWIAKAFPTLRVVLEHITTSAAVNFVHNAPSTVAATITAHHLVLTTDDVIGGSLNPHAFCKPIAKRREDMYALNRAVMSMGGPKFFLGSDSAPHTKTRKYMDGCAGIYSAPVLMPFLVQHFQTHAPLSKLEDFTSRFGAEFYGLPLNSDYLLLERKKWTVPDEYSGNVVPFLAGQTLEWQVKRVVASKEEAWSCAFA